MEIITIKAKKGYTLVTKDKSIILGKTLVCANDNDDYIEVKDTELEEIKKAIAKANEQ